MVEEIASIYLEGFELLRLNNNEAALKATYILSELEGNINSIEALFYLYNNSTDPTMRFYTINTMKRVITNNISHISDRKTLLDQMIQMIFSEQLNNIQSIIAEIISILITNDNIDIIIQLVQQSLESNNLSMMKSSLILLNSIDIGELVELSGLFTQIIEKTIDSESCRLAIQLAFKLGNYIHDQFFIQIFKASVQKIVESIDNEQFVSDIAKLIIESMDESKYFVDYESIYLMLVPLIGENEVDIEIQLTIKNIIDDVFDFLPNELIPTVFRRYLTLSQLIYSKKDQLSISDLDVFDSMCDTLSSSKFFIDFIFENFDLIYSEKTTRATSILLLASNFKGAYEEFFKKLDFVSNLLSQSVLDEEKLVRDASACAIHAFAYTFSGCINDVSQEIIRSIIKSLNEVEFSIELIESLTTMFLEAGATDSVFEESYNLLSPMVGTTSFVYQQSIFPCFNALCSSSLMYCNLYFEDIYQLIEPYLSNTSQYLDFAIECISEMSINCKKSFKRIGEKFTNFLFDCLDLDDTGIKTIVIKAIGKIIQHFKQYINNERLNKLIEQIHTDGPKYSVLVVSIICAAANEIPEICAEYLNELLQLINEQASEEDSQKQLCRALTLLTQAVDKCEMQSQEYNSIVMKWALNVVETTSDIEVIAEDITLLIELVKSEEDVNNLMEFCILLFSNRINSFKLEKYNDDLHPIIAVLIKHMIFRSSQNTLILFREFIPCLIELSQNDNLQMKEFALQILGQYIEKNPQEIEATLVNEVICISIETIRELDSDVSAYVINQITLSSAKIVLMDHLSEILELFLLKLVEQKNTEKYKSLIDNIINALGSIAMNLLENEFNIDLFLIPVLSSMPARIDSRENIEMMKFYLWLYERSQNHHPIEFMQVLIRLFSTPDTGIERNGDLINELIKIFEHLISICSYNIESVMKCSPDPEYLQLFLEKYS